jgi:hypothetical protein
MASTGIQALPYPALGDAANGPVAIQNLALAVEKKLVMSFATIAARNAAIPAPAEGATAYVTELDSLTTYQDGVWWAVGQINPTSVNAPAATAAPSAYPYGVQSRWVSGDATWPNANGVVVTERTSDTRCWQTFRASTNATPGMWVRRANLAAGPWSAWDFYAPWADTGWQNVTYRSGFTTNGTQPVRVRTLNGVTMMSGVVRRSDNAVWAINTQIAFADLPAGFPPNSTRYFSTSGSAPALDGRLLVSTDGSLTMHTGPTGSVFYSTDNASWTVD